MVPHLLRCQELGVGDYTLNTTALLHEAFVKLVDQDRASWNDRAHFLALASMLCAGMLMEVLREL